jgi:hypothetical protein
MSFSAAFTSTFSESCDVPTERQDVLRRGQSAGVDDLTVHVELVPSTSVELRPGA